MQIEPTTITTNWRDARYLLESWLKEWPAARFNGQPVTEVRREFVDAIIPLLAAPRRMTALEDMLFTSPTALLGTGEATTAPEALAEAWQALTLARRPPFRPGETPFERCARYHRYCAVHPDPPRFADDGRPGRCSRYAARPDAS